jgi:hypothetical protein
MRLPSGSWLKSWSQANPRPSAADPMRLEAKARPLADPTMPQRAHVGNSLEASELRPVWMAHQVIDDGCKSSSIFPANLAVMSAPMVRLVGPNGEASDRPGCPTTSMNGPGCMRPWSR